jgi:hypothetical protein
MYLSSSQPLPLVPYPIQSIFRPYSLAWQQSRCKARRKHARNGAAAASARERPSGFSTSASTVHVQSSHFRPSSFFLGSLPPPHRFTMSVRPLDLRRKASANESNTFPPSQPPVQCPSSRLRTPLSISGHRRSTSAVTA